MQDGKLKEEIYNAIGGLSAVAIPQQTEVSEWKISRSDRLHQREDNMQQKIII